MWSLAVAAGLGLVLGARHAFEPDHLTAISNLVVEANGARRGAILGAIWGLGHTLSLLVVGILLLLVGAPALLCVEERGGHGGEEDESDGEQVEPIQPAGEEQSGKNQTKTRTKRIGHNCAQPVFDKRGGNAEHRLGAEPGCEYRRGHDGKRQTAPGDGEVFGVMHAGRRVEPDPDRAGKVENHEG